MEYKLSLNEIEGQNFAVAKLCDFISNFYKQKKRAIMLYGPAGTGKTSAVYAMASHFNYEIVEMNASDFRDSNKIDSILGSAIKQQSLFSKGKIILVDEVDMVSGSKDRGCMNSLLKLLTFTTFPVFLTTNDPWNKKLNGIRTKTEMIKFDALPYESVFKILSKTSKKDNIEIAEEILKDIAIKARGDARAAINDLKTISALKQADLKIEKKSLDSLGERDKDVSIFNALRTIFKEQADPEIFENVQMELDDCFMWIDENLPLEYNEKDLAKAYERLSKADIFRKRIIRWQYWRFLLYTSMLMSAGVSNAKKESNSKFIAYKRPTRVLNIWMAKQQNAAKKEIAEKLAKATHISIKRAMKDMPFILASCKNEKFRFAIAKDLNLNSEETNFLAQTK